jgi:hypothetical protein
LQIHEPDLSDERAEGEKLSTDIDPAGTPQEVFNKKYAGDNLE